MLILSSSFFVDEGVGVGVVLREADGVGVALRDADEVAEAVGEVDVLGLAEADALTELEALADDDAEALRLGVADGERTSVSSPRAPLVVEPDSCCFSGPRVRVGLAVGEVEGDEVDSSAALAAGFDGRGERLPRSASGFSLRSRVAEADAVGLGALGAAITGAAAGTSDTTMLRATVKPSLCALRERVVVLTAEELGGVVS